MTTPLLHLQSEAWRYLRRHQILLRHNVSPLGVMQSSRQDVSASHVPHINELAKGQITGALEHCLPPQTGSTLLGLNKSKHIACIFSCSRHTGLMSETATLGELLELVLRRRSRAAVRHGMQGPGGNSTCSMVLLITMLCGC